MLFFSREHPSKEGEVLGTVEDPCLSDVVGRFLIGLARSQGLPN